MLNVTNDILYVKDSFNIKVILSMNISCMNRLQENQWLEDLFLAHDSSISEYIYLNHILSKFND